MKAFDVRRCVECIFKGNMDSGYYKKEQHFIGSVRVPLAQMNILYCAHIRKYIETKL